MDMETQLAGLSNTEVEPGRVFVSNPVEVIARSQIEGIESMTVEGVETYLGEVRNFKNHPVLKKSLPESLSISWTKMPSGEELPAHFHPCASMIIVTRGTGRSTGDSEIDVQEGDVIWIPEWNLHGFQGAGEFGFEALSIQFQPTAIFESEDLPETTYKDRTEVPLKDRQLKVISRDGLPSLHEVPLVSGVTKNLGNVKNFSGNELLRKKTPNFFSSAWVHLGEGETLDPHVHNVDSMIIITNGNGQLLGDEPQALQSGDVVFVPAGETHGFKGGVGGFWGLSIQFENESLYERQSSENVRFLSPYERLLKFNEAKSEEFLRNSIFSLRSVELLRFPKKREALFGGLQVMSNHFQRLMFSRMALCEDRDYHSVFLEHFLEELGHDRELSKERGRERVPWNPILESAASWFVQKNYLIDNPSRVVMIQMVLERGASLFYSHFAQVFRGEIQSEHIAKHCEADEGHDTIGVNLLANESERSFEKYETLLNESWSMLNLFLEETARVVQSVR